MSGTPASNEPRETLDEPDDAVETLIEVVDPGHVHTPSMPAPHEAGTTGLHVPRRTHRRISGPAGAYRRSWDNPILWRELMTRAYGSKPLVIKAAYLLCAILGVLYFYANPNMELDPWRPARALLPLAVLSLILINAQGVTALTSDATPCPRPALGDGSQSRPVHLWKL